MDNETDPICDDSDASSSEECPRPLSKKRCREQEAFQEWIEEFSAQREANNCKDVEPSPQNSNGLHRRVIASPREYQIELYERAKERNIIVVLPTGLMHYHKHNKPVIDFDRLGQNHDSSNAATTHDRTATRTTRFTSQDCIFSGGQSGAMLAAVRRY